MNFQDKQKDSVQSLLAQLRAAQDGPPPTPIADLAPSRGSSEPNLDARGKQEGEPEPEPEPRSRIQNQAGASSRQLNDLLSSLGNLPKPTTTTNARAPTTVATNPGSRQLIAPFGPIASLPSSALKHPERRSSDVLIDGEGGKGDISELSFTKSLPIISTLLADQGFRGELRRMKVDQDTLERRLWAKGEKVKGEWEKGTRTDKEIARITGKEISPTKKREWDKQLSLNLTEFHRNTCLPSIDGLAARHRARLQEMGVPGLGGDLADKGVRERVRRIMDVLEAGLEE